MMFAGAESEAVESIFVSLAEGLSMLYSRPYLAPETAERTLLLLQALFKVNFRN